MILLEILRFVFSSVWTFLGTIVLIAVVIGSALDGVARIARALRNPKAAAYEDAELVVMAGGDTAKYMADAVEREMRRREMARREPSGTAGRPSPFNTLS